MTTTASEDVQVAAPDHSVGGHPLDRLTPEEMAAAVAIVKSSEHFGPRMRFASLGLHAPEKSEVLAFVPGTAWDRRADAILLDNSDGAAVEMTVSLTSGSVISHQRLTDVQPAVILNEFFESEELIRTDPAFIEAMAKRGITDLDLVTIDPWSAGNYGDPLETSNRIIRALVWVRSEAGDNQYAHPVDGVMVIIDLNDMKVLRIEDEGVIPVPQTMNNYTTKYRTNTRTDIKPLDIVQPDGPSFTVDGDRIRWQKWDLRLDWTHREGLVLNTVTYTDGDSVRPVLYRASLAEMTVP